MKTLKWYGLFKIDKTTPDFLNIFFQKFYSIHSWILYFYYPLWLNTLETHWLNNGKRLVQFICCYAALQCVKTFYDSVLKIAPSIFCESLPKDDQALIWNEREAFGMGKKAPHELLKPVSLRRHCGRRHRKILDF